MTTCGLCEQKGEQLETQVCIACGRSACDDCRGPEGRNYKELGGRKGAACRECILRAAAYEASMTDQGREFYARVQGLLLPEAARAVDARLDLALGRVEALTNATLKDAEVTVERLVGRLEVAITNQRAGAAGDVRALLSSLRGTVVLAAIALALINLAAVAAAVLVAKVLR